MNPEIRSKSRIDFHLLGLYIFFAAIGFVLSFACEGFAADVDVIGDWESAADGWASSGGTLTPGATAGVTLGDYSAEVSGISGWEQAMRWQAGANSEKAAFMANDTFSIDFSVAASGGTYTGGYTHLQKVIMNNGSAGWQEVTTGNPQITYYWWSSAGERTTTLTVDYSAYKAQITDINPDGSGGGFIQILIECQTGGGAPDTMYFDNAALSGATVPPQRLHVEGNIIKNEDGNDVILRGASLIDVGQQEVWQDGVNTMIDRLTNAEDNNCDSEGWHTNVIRLPVFAQGTHADGGTWPYEFQNDPEGLYNVLRSAVDYCAEKNVYAVIDYHDINDMTAETISRAVEFWEYMAPLFADDTHVIFELFNEPINRTGTDAENWAAVKAGMETLISTVRTYAPDTVLMVGTPRWCQILGPTADDPLDDPNVVYVTHIYPSHWNSSDYSYYTSTIAAAAAVHPVILGEWGFMENSSTLFDGTITTYGDPLRIFIEGLGISNIAWVAGHGGWLPPMYDYNDTSEVWTLLDGDGYMGCYVKDWIYDGWSGTLDTTTIAMTIDGCQVAAGRTRGQDSLIAVGTLDSLPPSLVGIETIDVNIVSGVDGNDIYTEDVNFYWDTGNNTVVSTTVSTTGITKLTIDLDTRIFVIVARNINLTGLGAPVHLDLTIGNSIFSGDADESIVNRSNPIPTKLMSGYGHSLYTTLIKAVNKSYSLKDKLIAKGEIAVRDVNINLAAEEVAITWSDANEDTIETFTIPAGAFVASRRGHVFKCSRALTSEGARVTAVINLDKCTFKATIYNTDLSVTEGDAKFSVTFADFDETDELSAVPVTRPTTTRRFVQ